MQAALRLGLEISETENNKEKAAATESPDVMADMAASSDNTGAVAAYSENVADDTECTAEESMPVSGGGGGAGREAAAHVQPLLYRALCRACREQQGQTPQER